MVGKVLRVVANLGEHINEDEPLLVMEAMKMEIEVVAPETGTVTAINVAAGDSVNPSTVLMVIELD